MIKNKKKHRASKLHKIVADFASNAIDDAFWDRFFEIEEISHIHISDEESLVIRLRDPQTGIEKKYEGVRLKPTLQGKSN